MSVGRSRSRRGPARIHRASLQQTTDGACLSFVQVPFSSQSRHTGARSSTAQDAPASSASHPHPFVLKKSPARSQLPHRLPLFQTPSSVGIYQVCSLLSLCVSGLTRSSIATAHVHILSARRTASCSMLTSPSTAPPLTISPLPSTAFAIQGTGTSAAAALFTLTTASPAQHPIRMIPAHPTRIAVFLERRRPCTVGAAPF